MPFVPRILKLPSLLISRKVLACLVLIAYSPACFSLSPSLYVSFDRGFDGLARHGVVKPIVKGLPKLVDGRSGMAMQAGSIFGHLEFPTKNILNLEEGTIEFWVKPIDWLPGDEKFHVFFQVQGDGALYLYKYYDDERLLWLATGDHKLGPYYTVGKTIKWSKGDWHHLAASWSRAGLMLYIDGEPVSQRPVEARFPTKLAEIFSVGDRSWHTLRTTSTLIDELKIYDKKLTHRQILASYQGKDESFEIDIDSFELQKSEVNENGTVIYAVVSTEEMRDKDAVATVTITSRADETVIRREIRLADNRATFSVDLSALNVGEYDVHAKLFINNREVGILADSFVVPDLSFLNTAESAVATVPIPWSRIEKNKNSFEVWGRKYLFDAAALPEQILSQGAPILASPIRLHIHQGSNHFELIDQDMDAALNDAGDTAIIRSVFSWSQGRRHELVRVESRLEFDGLLWIKLSSEDPLITGEDSVITIEIPLNRNIAKLKHRWSGAPGPGSGKLNNSIGLLDNTKFIPFYWVGDDDIGLFWFSESAKMWPNRDSENAIQIVRDSNAVVMRLNIKTAGQQNRPKWEFEFGLMATPVKPFPDDWRTLRIAPAKSANIEIIWPDATEESFRYYGYPAAYDENEFAERLERIRSKGRRAIPYICPTYIATNTPEWPFFKNYWSVGQYDATSADVMAYGAPLAMTAPNVASWQQFITDRTAEFLQQYDMDGVYFDNVQPYGIYAQEVGLGYLHNNEPRKEYPIMAYREVFKQLYHAIKKANPKALIIAHMSGNVTIPILSFADAYLDGEQYRGKVRTNYFSLITLEQFRAEFAGKNWGLIPIFLPEYDEQRAKQDGPSASMMTLLLLHDVLVWPIWANSDYIDKVYHVLDEFDTKGSQFIPYFSDHPLARSDKVGVLVSGYCKDDGACLAVVGNTSDYGGAVEICPFDVDTTRQIDVFNIYGRKERTLQNNECVKITLEAASHAFVRYAKRSAGR